MNRRPFTDAVTFGGFFGTARRSLQTIGTFFRPLRSPQIAVMRIAAAFCSRTAHGPGLASPSPSLNSCQEELFLG